MNTPPSERIIESSPRWRRILVRTLIFVSIVAILASIILIILYSKVKTEPEVPIYGPPSRFTNLRTAFKVLTRSFSAQSMETTEICSTSSCLDEASMFMKNMDFSVNPCVDFYQFVCGKFKTMIIPQDKAKVDSFSIVNDKVTHELIQMLEEPPKNNDQKPTKLCKTYYGLCMDTFKIDQFGAEPLLKILELAGNMPVLIGEAWDADGYAWLWTDTIKQLRQVGYRPTYIIDIDIQPGLKDSATRIIRLSRPSLGLDDSMGLDLLIQGLGNKVVEAYYYYMIEMVVLLGATPSSAENEMKEALQFEIELAKAPGTVDLNVPYNTTTIGSLIRKFPKIPWLEYIKNIISVPISINEQEPVEVYDLAYLETLEKLLEKTPKRVQANYLLWRAIRDVIQFLPKNFRDKQLKFLGKFYGITSWTDRKIECAFVVSKSLVHAVAAEYIKRYVKYEINELKVKVGDLVNRVRIESGISVSSAAWLDEESRKNVTDKLATMGTDVGYPIELLDDAKVAAVYQSLEINGEYPYLLAGLAIKGHEVDSEFDRLRKKVVKGDWQDYSNIYTVNAKYLYKDNTIMIPPGILKDHFYSDTRPNYLNYGAIGWVAGHEITHVFANNYFRNTGKLKDSWNTKTTELFTNQTKCIVNQYSNYFIQPLNVMIDGYLTLSENIADNGGAKFAYNAYQKWVADNHVEDALPGFETFTPNQMFWISAATTWCSASRPENLHMEFLDKDPPKEFRVKGALSNSEDFARDFNCPVGSPMNPKEKCSVW